MRTTNKNNSNIEITNLEIRIGEDYIILSIEDARELLDALKSIFYLGDKEKDRLVVPDYPPSKKENPFTIPYPDVRWYSTSESNLKPENHNTSSYSPDPESPL